MLHGSKGVYNYRFSPGGNFVTWYASVPNSAFPTTISETGSLRGSWKVNGENLCLKVDGRFAYCISLFDELGQQRVYHMRNRSSYE